MAYYSIFPEKDTTLYSHPDRTILNSGHDEILEIVKEKGKSDQVYYPSRVLLKFNSTDIIDVLQNKVNNTWSSSLQLFSTEHKNLYETLNLQAYAVSTGWNEGTGRFSNLPSSSNGASWIYKDNTETKTQWTTGSIVTTGLTYGSSSIAINALPSGSQMELTINGVDFVPVISASLFDNNDSEFFVEASSSVDLFAQNLIDIINISQSLTLVTASYNTSNNTLILSGSNSGSSHNVTITTSSITGNNQIIFSSTAGFSVQGGTSTTTIPWATGTTGSISSTPIKEGGGEWFTGSGFYTTQQFTNGDVLDTDLDVTSITNKHSASLFYSSTYPTGIFNNGFIVKQPQTVEENTSSSFGEMKYYSTDTHTIYAPKLTFKWDDSVYSHSGTILTSGDIFLSLYNNKSTFQRKSKQRFRLTTRKRYPDRTFVTSSNYLDVQYLPATSYYSVRDGETDEVIIPFDTSFTKLSADSEGMYFDLYMDGLQPERYYKLMFRSDLNDGIKIFDEDYIFKVIR